MATKSKSKPKPKAKSRPAPKKHAASKRPAGKAQKPARPGKAAVGKDQASPAAADIAVRLGLPAPVSTSVRLDLIKPDPKNVRALGHSDDMVEEMAASLKGTGQLQPIGLVEDAKGKGYRLIWGHLRYLGAKKAGLESLDARVFRSLTDEQIVTAQAIENFTRTEPTPLDEAMAVDRLTDGRAGRAEMTVEDVKRVAALLGWHERRVRRCEKLLRLPPTGLAARLLAAGRLTIHQAESISLLADPKEQDILADMAARDTDGTGGMSEYAVSRHVKEHRLNLRGTPWKLDVEFAGKPPCTTCPHNAKNRRGLFEDLVVKGSGWNESEKLDMTEGAKDEDPGMCLMASCFNAKEAAARKAIKSAVEKSTTKLVALTTSAKKDAKKAGEDPKPIPVTATTLDREHLIPAGIKPTTLVNQVRKALPASMTTGSKEDDGGSSLPKPNLAGKSARGRVQADPREVAKQRHAEALEVYRERCQYLLAKSLVEKPGRTSLLMTLMETKTWRDRLRLMWGGKDQVARIAKACQSPDVRKLLGTIAEPSIEAFKAAEAEIAEASTFHVDGKAEKITGLPSCVYDYLGEIERPVFELLLKAVGVQIPSEPTLEQFLAEVGEKPEEPKAAGKKGKTKKGAKDDAAVAAAIDADGGAPSLDDEGGDE